MAKKASASDTNVTTPRNTPSDTEATERTPRGAESREADARPMEWQQPDLLPTPEKSEHPDWVFRWIRTSMAGQEDNRNVSMRFREGWEPVKLEDHPELMVVSDHGSAWAKKGAIEVGGLLLCKAPRELMESRSRKLREQSENMMNAIDNNMMSQEDERMPMFKQRSTKVSFGS